MQIFLVDISVIILIGIQFMNLIFPHRNGSLMRARKVIYKYRNLVKTKSFMGEVG